MTEGGKLRLVIATSAFIMGIDYPDICNAMHFGPPSSAVQYVQDSGRGGRNGNSLVALLLCGKPEKIQKNALNHIVLIQQSADKTFYLKTFSFTKKMNFLKISACVVMFVKRFAHV